MSDRYDEISLRDLYLIIRRGFPLILAVTVLSAVAALLFVTLRTQRYQAETTVLINPTPVNVQGTRSLALEQRNDISWETYQTIAFSRAVLEDALQRLGSDEMSVDQLRGSGDLTRLVGPQNPTQVAPLTIAHEVTNPDPALAVRAADAWAAATVETVGASMLASLESVRSATAQRLDSLERDLEAIEARWQEFQSRDQSQLIESQLIGLAGRIPLNESLLEDTERQLANVRAQRETLAAVSGQGGGVTTDEEGADQRAAVELLGEDTLAPETLSQLRAVLEEGGTAGDLVGLVRQVELQRLTAQQAGLTAQRDATQAQLERLQNQGQELRERQAGLVVERDRLQRQRETAATAVADLAALVPVLEYVYELAPSNSRILNRASIPTDPVGPRRLLVAALAAMVGGMLALLFVFLRAAVSEPGEQQVPPEPVRATAAR